MVRMRAHWYLRDFSLIFSQVPPPGPSSVPTVPSSEDHRALSSGEKYVTMSAGKCSHEYCSCPQGVFNMPLGGVSGAVGGVLCLKCNHPLASHDQFSPDAGRI